MVGVLGGVHCAGMCGGIVAALSLAAAPTLRPDRGGRARSDGRTAPGALGDSPARDAASSAADEIRVAPAEVRFAATPVAAPSAGIRWSLLLGYNIGRIASYTFAGALAGAFGALAVGGLDVMRQVLAVIAAVLLIAAGFYLARWWTGLAQIERAGAMVWRRLEPYARRLIPVRGVGQALVAGAVWGWLPCGLVYSVLLWAMAAANPVHGALILLAFGVGTLPNLLLMGAFAMRVRGFLSRPLVRRVAGTVLILMGAWALFGSTGALSAVFAP